MTKLNDVQIQPSVKFFYFNLKHYYAVHLTNMYFILGCDLLFVEEHWL